MVIEITRERSQRANRGPLSARTVCRAWAVIALVAMLVASSASRAEAEDEWPTIPMGEIGMFVSGSHRPTFTNEAGGQDQGQNAVGAGIRMDISVIGLLLPVLVDLGHLRIGDLVGLDLGFDSTIESISGHFIFGGQVSYELSKQFGLGARLYSLTIFDGALGRGDTHENFIVGEVSGRYQRIIARARFSVANAGVGNRGVSDYGGSVRLPTSWKIMGYDGWQIGADVDYIAYDAASGSQKLTRVGAVVALGF